MNNVIEFNKFDEFDSVELDEIISNIDKEILEKFENEGSKTFDPDEVGTGLFASFGFGCLEAAKASPMIIVAFPFLLISGLIKSGFSVNHLLAFDPSNISALQLGHFFEGLFVNFAQWLPVVGNFLKDCSIAFSHAALAILNQIVAPLLAALFFYKSGQTLFNGFNELNSVKAELEEQNEKEKFFKELLEKKQQEYFQKIEDSKKLESQIKKLNEDIIDLEFASTDYNKEITLLTKVIGEENTKEPNSEIIKYKNILSYLQKKEFKIQSRLKETKEKIKKLEDKQKKYKEELKNFKYRELPEYTKDLTKVKKEKYVLEKKKNLAVNKIKLGFMFAGLGLLTVTAFACMIIPGAQVAVPGLFAAISLGSAYALGYYKKNKVDKLEKEVRKKEIVEESEGESESEGDSDVEHVKPSI